MPESDSLPGLFVASGRTINAIHLPILCTGHLSERVIDAADRTDMIAGIHEPSWPQDSPAK